MEDIKKAINFQFADFLSLFSRGIVTLLFAFIIAWKFTIVFLVLIPFMVLSMNFLIHFIKKYSIREFIVYGSSGKIAQECLSSVRTVISFGIQRKMVKNYEERLVEAEKVSIKKGILQGFFNGAFFGIFDVIYAVGIFYAIYLSRSDSANYTVLNLIPAFFCIFTSSIALGQSIPFLSALGGAKGSAKKVFDLIELKSSIDIMDTAVTKLNDLKGDIEFDKVCFSYPQRPDVQVLRGLNLKIPAGKTVAFCGAR